MFQRLPHHLSVPCGIQTGSLPSKCLLQQDVKTSADSDFNFCHHLMLSNLPLSVAWKQIGLGFKILSRNKLTREGTEGLIWMQADTGFSEDFDVLKKKNRGVWGRWIADSNSSENELSKPSSVSWGDAGGGCNFLLYVCIQPILLFSASLSDILVAPNLFILSTPLQFARS